MPLIAKAGKPLTDVRSPCRRLIIFTSLSISVYVVLLAAIYFGGPHTFEWINDTFYGGNTTFSKDFNEQAFLAIQEGMTRAEIENALGPPIRVSSIPCSAALQCRGSMLVYSSQIDPRMDYKVRTLILENDKVVRVIKTFFME